VNEPEIVVVAAGPGPSVALPAHETVIAADGGADRAAALGLEVDLVIGDLDSISADRLAALEERGARVVRHPEAKDATDLELALDQAVELRARRVLVVASAEGRLDHLFASLVLLGSERYAALELDAIVGDAVVHLVRGSRRLHGREGELLSLFALGGPACDIATLGLAFPLHGETLEPGSSRGVSNVFTGREATVAVGDGVLLAIRPGAAAVTGAA